MDFLWFGLGTCLILIGFGVSMFLFALALNVLGEK